jgi:AraC-like DNA-binding protein
MFNLFNKGARMYLPRLLDLVTSQNGDIGTNDSELTSLSVLRRDAPSAIEAAIYEPVLCLILQGSKVTSIGDQSVKLSAGDALLVSHDLPVVSAITEASANEPYLAIILTLDLAMVRDLCDQIGDVPKPDTIGRSLAAGRAESAWLAPLVRYVELVTDPFGAKVLGPATLREIHYRLLLSSIGGMLGKLLVTDSHANRIAKAIRLLRTDYCSPLPACDLARAAGMSTSSFHQHFKAVTGTTPLQYQKDLRLIEAKALLMTMSHSVSQAAYAVGYESPNHFSRDFSRKFGAPPSREGPK